MNIFKKQGKGMEVVRATFAVVMSFVWVFSPIVPVINIPFSDEKLALGIEVPHAEAAYGNGYEYRRSVTINESKVTGTGDLTNFPVLMSFTADEFRTTGNGGRVTDAQGDDIIFTSDSAGTVALDFEMERYNASTGEITAWVEVPTLDFNDNTVVYIFYGNSSVTTSQEDIPGTWDANFIGVYHMDGDASTQLDSADSSVSHDGTVSGATANATGKIGPAYSFDGVNDVITVADESELDVTNTGTFEAWVNTTSTSSMPTSNMSAWTSRTAPTGVGLDEYSQLDSVVVGERIYYGNVNCTTATDAFKTASSTLDQATVTAWAVGTSPTGACASTDGSSIGVDSDGQYIWYAVLNNDSTTATFSYATSTLNGSISAWKNPANPTGIGAAESSSIDVVITGNKAYFYALMLTGTTEADAVASINLDGSGWSGWANPAGTIPNGGSANEGCGTGMDTNGDRLYIAGTCGNSYLYGRMDMSLNGTADAWTDDTDPTTSGAGEHGFNDITIAGDYMYHAVFHFTTTVEAFQYSSSTLDSTTPAMSWINLGTGQPNGAATTNSADAALETDGKNLFYSAFIHDGTTPVWATASSSLPARPFISKRNAYEAIQVGSGYVFDWAGKPTTFGTSTAPNTFKHIAVTHDGSKMIYMVNGVIVASSTVSTDFQSNANALLLGAGNRSDGTSLYFGGTLDEVRVSNTARSADWIQTQYNNQNATSTFYTLGSEVAAPQPATISGMLYGLNEAEETAGGRTLRVRVGTSTAGIFSTTTVAGTGVWRITNIQIADFYEGMPIHTWVDNDSTFRAFTFTKASSTVNSISGVDLWQNRVTLKHEGFTGTSTTNTDLSYYDADTNTSLQFNATAGGALEVYKSQEFRIAPGTEFAPGGTVTLHGNASTTNPDGDLRLMTGARQNGVATTSILTLGSNSLTLAGNWLASSTAMFTTSGTVTFNSTSTQQKQIVATSSAFSALTFNSSGGTGSWTFAGNAASTTGNLTITAGTVTAPSSRLSIGGNYSNSGTFTHNSGTTTFNGASTQTLSGTMTSGSGFSHVEFSGAGTKTFGSTAASTTNFFVLSGSGAVTAPSSNLSVAGHFVNAGTFTSNGGTVYMTGTAHSLNANTTFRNLSIGPNGAGTITMASTNLAATGTISVSSGDTLSIGSGLFATSTDSGTIVLDGTVSGSGSLVVQNSTLGTGGTLNSTVRFAPPNTTALTMPARSYGGTVELFGSSTAVTIVPQSGTHTITGSLFVNANGATNVTLDGSVAAPTMTIGGDIDFTGGGAGTEIILSGSGTWTTSGHVDLTGGTFTASSTNTMILDGSSKLLTSASQSFATLALSGSLTLVDNLTVSKDLTLSGTLTAPGRTVTMTGTGTTLVGGGNTLGALFVQGSTTLSTSNLTVGSSTVQSDSTLTVDSGRLLTATSTMTLFGSLLGTGTTTFGNASYACSNVPTTGEINVNVRLDASAGNCSLPSRIFRRSVELLSDSAASSRTVTASASSSVLGSMFLNAANTQNIVFDTQTNNAALFVGGNIDFVGAGAGSESVTSGAAIWDIDGSLDISNGAFAAPSTHLSVGGNYVNTSGTFTHNSGTTTFDGLTTQALSGSMIGTSAFNHLWARGTLVQMLDNASTTNVTIEGKVLTKVTFCASGCDNGTGTTTWAVPSGVTSIVVKAWGAGGGAGFGGRSTAGGAGAGGGAASSTLVVTPGESLDVYVPTGGAAGTDATGGAGSNGAGTGGDASDVDAGGGGAGGAYSAVWRGESKLIIAGGGGGGGGGGRDTDPGAIGGAGGGDVGITGSNDAGNNATGGGRGTMVAGGAVGTPSSGATAGGVGAGGFGADTTSRDGGGGGGGSGSYGGGGGGGQTASSGHGGGGGGGGSSYGQYTLSGSGTTAGGSADADYAGSAGQGGAAGAADSAGSAGSAGRIVISYYAPLGVSESSTLEAPPGLLSISGHYTNRAVFDSGTGTTTFIGSGAQTISGRATGTSAFYNVEILNSSATTTFTSSASTTNNFYSVTPGAKVQFAAGATSTLQNLIILGGVGNEIRLWSTALDSMWNLYVPGTRSVSYADVRDSDACSAAENIDVSDGTNINTANNRCWQFTAAAAILELLHYIWRADDGSETGASAYAAADTAVSSGVYRGDKVRLRYLVDNSGDGASTGVTYRIETASSTDGYTFWSPVAATADGTHWQTDEAGFYLDGASSTDASGILSNPGGATFTAGYLKSTGNQTSGQALSTTQFTELEYVLRSNTSTESYTNYRFRLTNAGSTATFLYTVYPEIMIHPPAQRPQNGSPGGGEGNGNGAQQSGGDQGGGNGGGGENENGGGGQQGGGASGGGGGGDSG